jgi:hypothetical protein
MENDRREPDDADGDIAPTGAGEDERPADAGGDDATGARPADAGEAAEADSARPGPAGADPVDQATPHALDTPDVPTAPGAPGVSANAAGDAGVSGLSGPGVVLGQLRGPEDLAGVEGEPVKRWWTRSLVVSSAAVAAIAALTLATIVHSPAASTARVSVGDAKPTTRPPAASTPAPSTAAPTTPPVTTTPPAPATTPPTKAPAPSLPTIIDALTGSHTGSLSVAVAELDGSRSDAYARGDNDDGTFDTASIVKVDILAALLLRTQREGTSLTGRERDLATDMIEASDNDAALALWEDIGGAAGLHTANKKLGLRHTTGGPGDLWGLTQTTAPDQITLLRAVFTTHSALTAASRSYLTGLMKSVESGQRWGVSAADSDGSGYAIKNGWLQRSATGLWDINSIGEVRYQGHTLLISVLSEGQYSEQGAIDLVQRVALAAAKTLVARAAN